MKTLFKHILYLLIPISVAFSSCYKDLSTYPIKDIKTASLDTAGIPKEITLGYQGVLKLSPKFSEEADAGKFKISWQFAKEAGADDIVWEEISDKLDLEYKVTRPISSKAYILNLILTDVENDNLSYNWSWEVKVIPSIASGIIVAETKDGSTTDFSYIKNKNITDKYTGDDVVIRDILADMPQGKIKSLVTKVWYSAFGLYWRPHTNCLWAITKDGQALRYDTKDFSLNGDSENDENIIFGKPDGLKFNYIFKTGPNLAAKTNMGLYMFGTQYETRFVLPNETLSQVEFSNDIVATTSIHSTKTNMVWYDETKNKFQSYFVNDDKVYVIGSYEAGSAIFDPNDLPGFQAVAAETNSDNSVATFLLKDKSSGVFEIYQLNQYRPAKRKWDNNIMDYIVVAPPVPAHAKAKFSIPAEGLSLLNNAVSVFFAKDKDENILFVATKDALYSIVFGLGEQATVNATPIYQCPSGETITLSKLYIQGQYNQQADGSGYKKLPWNMKGIILASKKDEKGIVRVIPFDKMRPGQLSIDKMIEYKDFGTILDIITIGL